MKDEMKVPEIVSNALTAFYSGIFLVDLLEDCYVPVKVDTQIENLLKNIFSAQEAITKAVFNTVLPEQIPKMLDFVNLRTLPVRMKMERNIDIDYKGAISGWVRGSFIEAQRDDNGNLIKVLYTYQLIDEVRRLEIEHQKLKTAYEIAEQASQAKTAFLFNMSHDIRTPMNAIIGYAQLIKKDFDNPKKVLHYQEKMQQASNFLLSLINNVLDMARIESGKMEVDNEYVNMVEEFNEIIGVFEAAAREKKITFEVTTEIKTPHVMGDIIKIKQIYSNLISNAIKYTPVGGTVRVSIREYEGESDETINFESVFEDTGIGMSKEFLPHLFEAFEREQTTTTNKTMGTGLGMPIVKRLVNLLGGTIEVESELGKGTKFIVTIPHKIAKKEYSQRVEKQIATKNCLSTLSGKRILLAEDNELNAEISTIILEDMGLMVERAEDGIICVNMLEKASPGYYDLILMDVQMPNMDGYKATTIIRRFPDKEKAYIPIIAMTANAFDEDKRNALQIGMDGHIAKPLEIDILKYTLGLVLTRTEIENARFQFWKNRLVDCDAIKEFETMYRLLGNPCGWLIYEAYGDEKIRYADKILIHMFGCEDFPEFLKYVGGSFKTMVHQDDVERVEDEIFEQINNSSDCIDRVKYRIIRKDGLVRMIDDIGKKAFIENGIPVFYVCLVDVTDKFI